MATFRNTEYLVLVDANGDFKSGQVKRVQLAPDGTPFPAPPIDFEQADLTGLLEQFNAVVLRENAALKAEVTHVTQLNSTTVGQLQSQINQMTTDHQAAIATLQSQLATAQAQAANNADAAQLTAQLQAELEEKQAEIVALQTRVDSLKAIAPFDPRKITVRAFYARLSHDETLMLLTDEDPIVRQIADMLAQWSKNDWPIFFDTSPEFAQAMGYLVQSGKLSPERVQSLTQDASHQEAPSV